MDLKYLIEWLKLQKHLLNRQAHQIVMHHMPAKQVINDISYIEQWAWHWHWLDCPHHCWRCICRDPHPALTLRLASDSDCAPLSSHCSALLLPDHEKIFYIGLFGKYLMIFHLFCPVNVRRRISRSFTPEFNMFSFLHHKVAIRRVSLDAGRNWNNINY